MAIVTDPDNLDRFQVAVDPTNEEVSIRAHGAIRTAKRTDGDVNGATTFDAAGADFVTDLVAQGDILTIVKGTNIGHYTVDSVTDLNTLEIQETFPDTGEGAGQTFRINQTKAVGGASENLADGVTLQALYSFLKEEWDTFDTGIFSAGEAPDLIAFDFPFQSITREQFIIGGVNGDAASDWDLKDDTTRNLIRTGGWQVVNSSNVLQQEYAGIITLGTLPTTTQVTYQQVDATENPQDFVLTGAVNQAIKVYDVGGDDNRSYLVLRARARGQTYVQSEIADIGVTTIEALVNRFPLSSAADPAITDDDGVIAGGDGTGTYSNLYDLTTAADGVTADVDGDTGTVASAGSTWDTGANQLYPGDVMEVAEGADLGFYEIISVDDANTVTVDTSNGRTFSGASSLDLEPRTKVLTTGTNATLADVDGGTGTLDSSGADFASAGRGQVNAGDLVIITADDPDVIGIYKVVSRTDADTLVLNTSDQIFGGQTNQSFTIVEPGMYLQFFEDKTAVIASATNLNWNASTNQITRTAGDWGTDGFEDGMKIRVRNADTASNNGEYTIDTVDSGTIISLISTDRITTDTTDTGASVDGNITGAATIADATNLDWSDDDPDTLTRTGGTWTTADGFKAGMGITVTGADTAANDGTYIVGSLTTTEITFIASEAITDDTTDTGAAADGNIIGTLGVKRTVNAVDYPFHFRLFANGGTLSEVFQYIQKQLRQPTDIEESDDTARGDITDLLMTFASPNGVMIDCFPDDLSTAELNNVTYRDSVYEDTTDDRNNAFLVGLSINFSQTLVDTASGRFAMYFTSVPSGDFGTVNAIIVDDSDDVDITITEASPEWPSGTGDPAQFTFDYTNNNQGGRTPDTNAAVTLVAIGTDEAQHVLVTGTITKINEVIFTMTSPLERNYANP
jgi:hypothetical protein